MNRECNVTKRVQTAAGLRYCPVVFFNNGRIKPDLVRVNGREERHAEGAYYIEWREGSKRFRKSVGNDPVEAHTQRLRKEAELTARANGIPVPASHNGDGKRLLTAAIAEYLEEVKLSKKPKTLASYSTALDYFAESCAKGYLEDIDRKDLLRFAAFLRDSKNQSPRSCSNKFSYAVSFLKAQGIQGLTRKHDRPRFVQEEPEIYEQDELDSLFKACDSTERLWFEFFLMTGMREQEVMHCYWSDVDLKNCIVRVSYKPDRGWSPKAYKEREIPIPKKLAESLKGWKAKSDKACSLVFPTAGCNPKLDFWDCLKAVARRAKLKKENFWLHKFRATFATRCLQANVDLRTVQEWLGHSDLESTMRYLKPNRSQEVRDTVNSIF